MAQKLTARTEITTGLTLADLMHLVNAGASRKVALSTLGEFLFGAGRTLKITYTGKPLYPLMFNFCAGNALLPVATVLGQATYMSGFGPSLNGFSYSESNAAVGDRVLTLSFDDLKSVGNVSLAITNCAALTQLDFPELLTCANSFNPGTLPALTGLTIPKLTHVGSSFLPQSLTVLTSVPSHREWT